MTASKGIRIPWTEGELKILRDAWVRGMTAKYISLMLLKHRTPSAIYHMMSLSRMTFDDKPCCKTTTVIVGVPLDVYDQLKSSATAQGVPITKLCRTIIKNEVRGLNVRRTGSYSKEYKRDWMREWRARQRQKSAAE